MPNTKTLGAVVNAALTSIKDPKITAFTADNILQDELIAEANNRVRLLRNRTRYDWTLERASFLTTDDITDEYVSVTAGSATVTSVDEDGDDSTGFSSVTTNMFLVVGTDLTSYSISSVDTSGTPHTAVIEQTYTGTTATNSASVFYQNMYGLSGVADLDKVEMCGYGEGRHWSSATSGSYGDYQVGIVDIRTIYGACGGNLHVDTSGKPRLIAQMSPDSSDDPRFVLWPYPDDDYLFELWYSRTFTDASAFATVLFAADAPDLAYDYVEYGCKSRAALWENKLREVEYWEGRAGAALKDMISREHRDGEDDNSMDMESFRVQYGAGIEARSQLNFDRRPAWRF